MTYQLYLDPQGNAVDGVCRHNDDGSNTYLPNDLRNTEWVAYQAWVALGNTPDPA